MQPEPTESAVIGRGVRVKGEVTSTREVIVEGEVEGSIHLEHALVVAPGAAIDADVRASRITVRGRTSGRLEATERLEVRSTGVVSGELVAPTVILEDGAVFNGAIHMDVALPDEV